jgi:hypothetical protein
MFVVAVVVGVSAVVAAFGLLALYARRKYISGIRNVKLIATVNPEYVSTGEYILCVVCLLARLFGVVEWPGH